MAPIILLRHGRSTANGAGVLAGRTAGVGLDDTGIVQATALPDRLRHCRIARIVSSPVQRCRETVAPLAASLALDIEIDDRLTEVDYGAWSGRPLSELRDDPLWATVQGHPSGMTFPGGESMADVSARATGAVRHYAAEGSGAVLLCSHGDVLSMILADALGMHLDLFQRLMVSPASLSVVHYLPSRPMVQVMNDTAGLIDIGARPEESTGGDPGSETPTRQPPPPDVSDVA